MKHWRSWGWGWALLVGCGAHGAHTSSPPRSVVEMEALRIVAKHDPQGAYTFESYDAGDLFERANQRLDAGQCREAAALYDQLVREFPASGYISPSLYNAGLCLAQVGELESALRHFSRIIDELPDSPDVKHASLQAAHLELDSGHAKEAVLRSEALLARSDLDLADRLEAMTLRAQALLAQHELVAARAQADQALSFYRTHPNDAFPDLFFVAAANFVLAETIRETGEALAFPPDDQEAQKKVLVRRAELLLEAQREYFSTIRVTNAHWAAAAGHRIGAMYDTLWRDVMAAPVPATLSKGAREIYPQELAKLIKPLLRHAVRYWELTLMMIERTGVQTEWSAKTQADLERVRGTLLEQPPGPGGLPQGPGARPIPGQSAPIAPSSP